MSNNQPLFSKEDFQRKFVTLDCKMSVKLLEIPKTKNDVDSLPRNSLANPTKQCEELLQKK